MDVIGAFASLVLSPNYISIYEMETNNSIKRD